MVRRYIIMLQSDFYYCQMFMSSTNVVSESGQCSINTEINTEIILYSSFH